MGHINKSLIAKIHDEEFKHKNSYLKESYLINNLTDNCITSRQISSAFTFHSFPCLTLLFALWRKLFLSFGGQPRGDPVCRFASVSLYWTYTLRIWLKKPGMKAWFYMSTGKRCLFLISSAEILCNVTSVAWSCVCCKCSLTAMKIYGCEWPCCQVQP